VEEHTLAGMTIEEARRRTRLTFGGHEQVATLVENHPAKRNLGAAY